MTISHCWGDAKFFKLLESNREGLEREFDIKAPSKTFRDGIHITKEPDFRYL